MDNKFEKIPLIYLYIYKDLREKFFINQIIQYKSLVFRLKNLIFHIPRKYYDIVIKELIDYNLISTIKGGRIPIYELENKDYEHLIIDLNKIKKSTQRFKILKSRYKKLLNLIEEKETFDEKYKLLECGYEKLLRIKELKKLEGSHYW